MKEHSIHSNAKPRLSDIARSADVSIGTVSRVMNGKSDVAPALAERVLLAARALGYTRRPSSHGIIPLQSKTAMIGYLVDAPNLASVTSDPFMQHFLAGIEAGVNQKEGHLLFATCREEITNGSMPAMITEKRVQGIVFKKDQNTPDAWIRQLAEQVPTVMLMSSCEDRSIHSVMCDNHAGTYQAMRYLRDLGHQRIGFLTIEDVGMPHNILHLERLEAYGNYTRLLNCEINPAYVQIPSRDHTHETLPQDVEKGLKAFLALGEKRPTAVICATDIYAFALLNLATKYGVEVPHDLSVVGFMNTETCEHSSPPLTSVCLSGEEVGRVAVDLLYERIENPELIVRHVSVGTKLIERLSCAPVSR